MPKLTFKNLRGVNTVSAQTRLKEGEFQNLQNVRGRPFYNLAKRRGIYPSGSSTTPVYFIGDFDLDAYTTPLLWSSTGLTFYPDTPIVVDGHEVIPDPLPTTDPLAVPTRLVVLQIESVMRAVNERSARTGLVGAVFDNSKFDSAGDPQDVSPATQPLSNFWAAGGGDVSMPVNAFYATDLAWNDTKNGNPTGTRAAFLVNQIRTALSDIMVAYISSIEGQATVLYYDATSLPLPDAATTITYNQILAQLRTAITKLTKIGVVGSVNVGTSKTVDANSSGGIAGAEACIVANWAGSPWGQRSGYGISTLTCSLEVTGGPSNFGVGAQSFTTNLGGVGNGAAQLNNTQGTLSADLTNYLTGTVAIFIVLNAPPSSFHITGVFGQTPRPTAALTAGLFSQWTAGSASVATSVTTGTITYTDAVATAFLDPVGVNSQLLGWRVDQTSGQVIFQITLSFTNP